MATIPTQVYPLLAVLFNAATDFTVPADHCETVAETLIESNNPILKIALCGRLNASLSAAPAHVVRARPAPSY
ncbi:Uncharacterised protein [Klebsiella michiganensis]|nr:Uncharacterised protein [Klebsiella michiganensis]